jgi:hypothetical protein
MRIGMAAVLVCTLAPNLVFAGTIPAWESQSLSADPTFDFETTLPGTATPFTNTVSGLSATFSSSGDPGGFAVMATFFQALTGNVLINPGPAGLDNLVLTIVFSIPQTNISMDFATNSPAGVPFNLDAFNGASAVGSASATGAIPSGFLFPEGVISFSGPAFNRVVLSSPALDFAVDNVSVSTTAIPEPGSLMLLIAGAISIAISRLNVGSKHRQG